jgi:hypothetical protein
MAKPPIKTINLLPEFLRTDKNNKFLSSTLDQWIQPPALERIDGYIGSTITPTYNSTADNYIPESLPLRKDYQLEPAVVFKDSQGAVQSAIAFDDLVNEIATKGGINNNLDRLFRSDFYSYDPHIDWDKLVNYTEYYWLVTGPSTIVITGQPTNTTSTFAVTDNVLNSAFVFSNGLTENPIITLYRGNTYNFEVNSRHKFFVKTDSSTGISDALVDNITNNGTSTGIVSLVVDQYTPDTLYYIANDQQQAQGQLVIKDASQNSIIDVENDIINKKNYRSGTGIELSNGMKIIFGGTVLPESYRNKEYWVEGVGDAIKLIDYNTLMSSELMASFYDEDFDATPFDNYPYDNFKTLPITPEYITINRASKDLNPWSRYNRWVHSDVIKVSAEANGQIPSYPVNLRAQRPIVEFKADLKLFNFGTHGTQNIDLIDTTTLDAFSIVEGSAGYHVDGVLLQQGHRIVFNADTDAAVRGKIYTVNYITVTGNHTRLQLLPADDYNVNSGSSVAVNLGATSAGTTWWFNGSAWQYAQQHNQLNQAPLFDLFDEHGYSYSDTAVHQSNFAGSKIFGYEIGTTGINDSILGFPLKYKNSVGIGSYLFKNYFTTDVISVSINNVETVDISASETFLKFSKDSGDRYANVWAAAEDYRVPILQFQNISTATSLVQITAIDNPTTVPLNLDVLVNNKKVDSSQYTITNSQNKCFVSFNLAISLNSTVLFKIYTDAPVNNNGYYEVPLGLTNNPLNGPIGSFTLSELSDHLDTAITRLPSFVGTFPGISNLRNISNVAGYGSRLISNANPLPFASIFIGKKEHNVVDAVSMAGDQYNQFKMAFLNKITSTTYNGNDVQIVDSILAELNQNKNLLSPYYLSDMVAYGNDKITRSWTISNVNNKVYPITSDFDPNVLGLRSVLVYLNNTQLLLGKDYEFIKNDSSIRVLTELTLGDQLTINDYANTEGSFIPPTPSKLGLYPKFEPGLYVDNTYVTPTNVIQCHDGSIMIAYNDYRDGIILELESRIFNNIKTTYRSELFDINAAFPGAFRTNEYSTAEINSILITEFIKWSGFYGIEYSTNSTFDDANPFTWNYTGSYNRLVGTQLNGYWRGIYKYFYDTDRPHTCPWEMLGFSIKPTWWEDEYGPAPYTSGNELLWNDIEQGIVKDPKNIHTNALYVRPGLSNLLPVDEHGNLVDPSVLISSEITTFSKRQEWQFGDFSPAETVWRRSSYWPFVVQRLLALTKPASYASLMYDPANMMQNLAGQWSYGTHGSFLNPKNVQVFGNDLTLTSGFSVYISEIGKQRDSNYVSKLIQDLEYFDVNLFHKVGGFVNKNNIQIVIDAYEPNSTGPGALLPQENYSLYLNTSNPVKSIGISGVIVQKSGGKFIIKGYDKYHPYFTTFTPIRNSSTPALTVGGISAPYVVWTAGTDAGSTGLNPVDVTTANTAAVGKFYQKGQIVFYGNRYYMVSTDHLAENVFNAAYYQSLPSLPMTGGATVQTYSRFEQTPLQVSYGTQLDNIQQVYDFIVGYGAWLESEGFIFDQYNTDLGSLLDWNFTVKEFLYWTTQNWADNSIIALSPFADQLKFKFNDSVVDNIFDSFYNYTLLKENGLQFPPKNLSVSRDEGVCTIRSINTTEGVYFAQLNSVQKEHAMVFDNKTVFNDTIYDIETGYRQRRVQLIGFRTAEWNGDYFTPGFVYDTAVVDNWVEYTDYLYGEVVRFNSKYYSAIQDVAGTAKFDFTKWALIGSKPVAELIPNFDYKINQFEDFYSLDIDNFDSNQQELAQHLIGYTPRVYLNNIFINPIAQYKFYQGFIREKGTKNAITKLSKASIQNLQGTISFNEEWAFRIGNYGSYETYQEIETTLHEGTFNSNPQIINFVSTAPTIPNDLVLYSTPADLLISPTDHIPSNTFVTTTSSNFELLTAGYVNLNDVTATAWNETSLLDIANNGTINEGDNIWLGNTNDGGWGIYRYQRLELGLISVDIVNPEESLEFTTDRPHNLNIGDLVSVAQYDSQVDGIHKIIDISSPVTFTVATTLAYIGTFISDVPGLLFQFANVRYNNFDSIPSDQELYKLPAGVKVWIDNNIFSNWAVYEKIDNYSVVDSSTSTSASAYGSNIFKNHGDHIVVETAPNYSAASRFDIGTIFVKNINQTGYIFNYNINQQLHNQYYTNTTIPTDFGTSLVYDNQEFNNTGFGLFYAGAPGASNVKSSDPSGNIRFARVSDPASALIKEGLVKISSVDRILTTEKTEHVLLSPEPVANERFGQAIYVQTNNTDTKKLLVGAPGSKSVYVYTITLSTVSNIVYNSTLTSTSTEFGYSIAGAPDCSIVAVGAPAANTVSVFTGTTTTLLQVLSAPDSFNIGAQFGNTIVVSDDGSYLFVTAPGVVNTDNSRGAVIVYKLVNGLFHQDQLIINPVSGPGMSFGIDIDINADTKKLIISALGTDKVGRKFDKKLADNTTFDSKTTIFDESIAKSGCVYVYERNAERFVFAQEINPGNLSTSTNFGQSILLDVNDIFVGSPNRNIATNYDQDNQTDYSIVYRYSKIDTASDSWSLIRHCDSFVEVDRLEKVSLIDTFNEEIVEYLDVIDPVKGKIAGIADQELKYKSSIDPAVYSIGIDTTVSDQNTNWVDPHIGELWWDLSNVKYVWYEQGDLTYRKNNWGRVFPGSTIDVYEWVGSTYLPSEWATIADTPAGLADGISGQPKFPDNTVVSVKQRYDSITDSFSNVYYFWVKNKVTIPSVKNRRISAYQVAVTIEDPATEGLAYAGIISKDAVIISNIAPLLVGNRINLNIAFDTINNQVPKHTEWLLLQENYSTAWPNAMLEKKLLDSLLGHDSLGTPVPDPTLSARTRYGIGIRPQQTMFKDRNAALRNLIEFSNDILKENVITGQYSFVNLKAQENIPDEYTHLYDRIVEDNETLASIDTRKLQQAKLSCIVANGKIIRVNIDSTGFGYLRSPTVTITGAGSIPAVITTTIDASGKINGVTIVESGEGYTTAPSLEVRAFTVIVQADSIYNGKWSKFSWRSDLNNWIREHTQKYNTSLYWKYIDWASTDYNQYQDYTYTVDAVYELYTLVNVPVGQYIKVKNSGDGNFIILRKLEDNVTGSFGNGYELVYKENGTIQLSDAIWSKTNSTYGFDQISSYDQTLYDQTPDLELEYILKALKTDIFINKLSVNWNRFFFKAVKYALTEQKLLDWAFKTSFINVVNNAGSLDQRPVYRLQNTEYFEDYIKEVKPYHSQIRGFTTEYATLEQSQSYTTDFDLPTYYDSVNNEFKNVGSNNKLLTSYPWKSWADNKTFTVSSISVSNPGAGYTVAPTVEIKAQPGDLGAGASAIAYIRSGEVITIDVINAGQGYLVPPIVLLKGGGSTSLTPATAYAQLYNGKIRTNKIGMKFDRINRYNQIGNANTTDSFICNGIKNEFELSWLVEPAKSLITVTLDKVRVLSVDYTIKYYTADYNGYKKKYSKIVFLNYIPKVNQRLDVSYKKSKDLYTSLERIENYYNPTTGMAGEDPAQLMSGLEYGRTQIRGLGFTATTHWDVLFGAANYSGFGTTSYADDISYYQAIELASTATVGTSTVVLSTTTGVQVGQYVNIISNTVNEFNKPTVTVKKINPSTSEVTFSGKLLNTLTNATFEFWSYDANSTALDSAIDGGDLTYSTALGINPEDIIIDGDRFYTPTTSFGPEELLDGQVTESVGINVYTKNVNGAPLVFTSSFDINASVTTTATLSVIPTTVDSISVIFNNAVFAYNSTTNFTSEKEFNINWATSVITIPPQPLSGKVSYSVIGIGSGNPSAYAGLVDYQKITVTNNSSDANLPGYTAGEAELVSLSGINTIRSAYVTVNGIAIPAGTTGLSYVLGSAHMESARAAIFVSNLPSGTCTVQAWFFATDVSYYNEVTEQVITVGEEPTNTFTLDNPPGTIEPADAQVIVEINDGAGRRQLLPPYVSYYQVTDINDRVFTIDNHVVRPPATYNLTTVRAYRNGIALAAGFDFKVTVNDNTITVYPNILKAGDVIAVLGLVPNDYDYDIIGNILHVPLQSGLGVSGAEIKVITFTDHDGMLMRTERFSGNANKRYQLSRPVINVDYLWVRLNGIPLKSNIDYDVLTDGVTVQLSDAFITTSEDDVVITSISSTKLAGTILGYRIFVDMLGRTHYKRLSKKGTTYLTQPLAHSDIEIHVADSTALTPPLLSKKIPGVILVDGERIEFLEIKGNVLRKLRRGTLGTAPAFYSDINTKVIDQSPNQDVPYADTIKKQIQFTSTGTNTYVISTSKLTTTTSFNTETKVTSNGITLSADLPAMDQIAVYYGGRQLRKSGTFYHDTTFAFDSPLGDVIGTTATVYSLPLTTTLGDSYIVTATNQVWVYTGSSSVDAVNGYVYQGMTYLEPEFSINTSTHSLMLNMHEAVQDDIELVIVQKQYSQSSEWSNIGISLMDSTTTPAHFLQQQPAELPDNWYYGGDITLTADNGLPLTDKNQEPLQGL